MTERYAVIGNPVAHSRSPWIHAEFARATRQDIEYSRIEAPLDGFERAVREFHAAGGRGLNVTLPFKGAAFDYCRSLSARAREARVVNTLLLGEGRGDNTDGVGLVHDLARHLEVELAGRSVLLLGAGGAAQGVVGALREAGIGRLVIANRTEHKAHALAALHAGVSARGLGALAGEAFDIAINATSAGLAGAAPELPAGLLREGMLAYDMVYGRDTPFLAAARAAGARTSDGLGMLVEQAAESFELWRGVRPETRPVLAELRARMA
jgi:shikimate dehydrogenase